MIRLRINCLAHSVSQSNLCSIFIAVERPYIGKRKIFIESSIIVKALSIRI